MNYPINELSNFYRPNNNNNLHDLRRNRGNAIVYQLESKCLHNIFNLLIFNINNNQSNR